MVLVDIRGEAIDKPMIFFIRANIPACNSPIYIGSSLSPLNTLHAMQACNFAQLEMMCSRPGDSAECARVKRLLAAHCIRGDWFTSSPEVLAMASGGAIGGDSGRTWQQLTDEQAVEIFNLIHVQGLRYRRVAESFGVAVGTVERIANARCRPHLFRQVIGEDGRTYATRAGDDTAPRYWIYAQPARRRAGAK